MTADHLGRVSFRGLSRKLRNCNNHLDSRKNHLPVAGRCCCNFFLAIAARVLLQCRLLRQRLLFQGIEQHRTRCGNPGAKNGASSGAGMGLLRSGKY